MFKNKTKSFWLLVLFSVLAAAIWNYHKAVVAEQRFQKLLARTPAPSVSWRGVQHYDILSEEEAATVLVPPALVECYQSALSKEDYRLAVGAAAMIIEAVDAKELPQISSAAAELWAGYALLRLGDIEHSEVHLLQSWRQASQPHSGDAAWLLALVAMQRRDEKSEVIWLQRTLDESYHYAFLVSAAIDPAVY